MADLCEMVGVERGHSETVRRYLNAFRASGLVRVVAWQRWNSPVYEWQAPFALEDAPQPPKPAPRVKVTQPELNAEQAATMLRFGEVAGMKP